MHDNAFSFNPLDLDYLNKAHQLYSKLTVLSPDTCNYVAYNCMGRA